jgi:hypothetical protein
VNGSQSRPPSWWPQRLFSQRRERFQPGVLVIWRSRDACSHASSHKSRFPSKPAIPRAHATNDKGYQEVGNTNRNSLTHFAGAISLAKAQWAQGSDLEAVLEKFGGDIVQAVQALKESKPEPTIDLEQGLVKLLSTLEECRAYCASTKPDPLVYPFARSERQVKDVLGYVFPDNTHLSSSTCSSTNAISVDLSKQGSVERFTLGPYQVPRLFNGLWQLSSPAWGSGTAAKQEAALAHLVECGLTTTDMADHYGDAELIYGDFRNRLAPEIGGQVYAATKWCVFSPTNQPVTTEWVLAAVKERCRRLGGRVELLQFHWYDVSSLKSSSRARKAADAMISTKSKTISISSPSS